MFGGKEENKKGKRGKRMEEKREPQFSDLLIEELQQLTDLRFKR